MDRSPYLETFAVRLQRLDRRERAAEMARNRRRAVAVGYVSQLSASTERVLGFQWFAKARPQGDSHA